MKVALLLLVCLAVNLLVQPLGSLLFLVAFLLLLLLLLLLVILLFLWMFFLLLNALLVLLVFLHLVALSDVFPTKKRVGKAISRGKARVCFEKKHPKRSEKRWGSVHITKDHGFGVKTA